MAPINKEEAEAFLPHGKTETKSGILDGDVPEYQPPRRRQGRYAIRFVVLAAISTVLLGLFARVPVRRCMHRIGGGFHPLPASIEQRVKTILTHTPLIGI